MIVGPLVDPKVYEVAELFVVDLLAETQRRVTVEQRANFTHRIAVAMQRAVEDEYAELARELRP